MPPRNQSWIARNQSWIGESDDAGIRPFTHAVFPDLEFTWIGLTSCLSGGRTELKRVWAMTGEEERVPWEEGRVKTGMLLK